MLHSLGTTRGKQGTLFAELFKFKELYDRNAPLAEVFPEMVAASPEQYGKVGLKDHANDVHRYYKEHKIMDRMQTVSRLFPTRQ